MSDKPTALNWAALGVLGLIWGASFMAAKFALESFAPMTISSIRIGIGAGILLLFCLMTGRKFPRFNDPQGTRIWIHMAIFGIITNALPFSLLNWGQNYVTSGFAGVTMALVPLFALPLAHFTLQSERMTFIKTIGFLIGFIGIVVLIEPARFMTSSGAALEPIARMACITAALCYALGTINTRLCPPVSTLIYSAGGLAIGFLIILPISLMIDGVPQVGSTNALAALLYLGVFPTAIATLLLVWVVRTAGPTFLTLVNYQVPIWAVILGVIFFSEAVPPSFVFALALILLGLAISQMRRHKP